MPTVLRQVGFAFMIYTHDHTPAHVYIWKGSNQLIVNLGDENQPPAIRDNQGIGRAEAKRAWQIIIAQREFLLAEWRNIHGNEETQ